MSTISDRLIRVREIAKTTLAGLTGNEVEPVESILVANSKYCGHRFKTRTHTAEWIIAKDQLKVVCNADQTVLQEVDLGNDARPVVWPNAA